MKKLGIIAGGGSLPREVILACQKQRRPFFVLALKGFCNPDLLPSDVPVKWVRLGGAGAIEKTLRAERVSEIVLIGSVRRPSVWEIYPDWVAFKFMMRVLMRASGDDGLLRAIIHEIEQRGFQVVGAHEVLPSLILGAGVLGAVQPTSGDVRDCVRGFEVAKLLGQADVGQSVVVQQGLVLAVEGIEGTDALIKRSKALRRRGAGGVLVKVKKPQQEERVDLPTIGPQTVAEVHAAGLRCIAAEAGAALFAKPQETIRLADQLGVCIMGINQAWVKKSKSI